MKSIIIKTVLLAFGLTVCDIIAYAQEKANSFIGAYRNGDGSGIMLTEDRYYYVKTTDPVQWFPAVPDKLNKEGDYNLRDGILFVTDNWGYSDGMIFFSSEDLNTIYYADTATSDRFWGEGLIDMNDDSYVIKDRTKVISLCKKYTRDLIATSKMGLSLDALNVTNNEETERNAKKTLEFINHNQWVLGVWQTQDNGAKQTYIITPTMVRRTTDGNDFVDNWVPAYHKYDYGNGVIQHALEPATEHTEDGLVIDVEGRKISSSFSEYYLNQASTLSDTPIFLGNTSHEFRSWLNTHLEYPEIAKENGISGAVRVSYTIDENGKVVNVAVVKGAEESLNKSAVRTIQSSPDWAPAYKDGQFVRVTYEMTLTFGLY